MFRISSQKTPIYNIKNLNVDVAVVVTIFVELERRLRPVFSRWQLFKDGSHLLSFVLFIIVSLDMGRLDKIGAGRLEVRRHGPGPSLSLDLHSCCARWNGGHHPSSTVPVRRPGAN